MRFRTAILVGGALLGTALAGDGNNANSDEFRTKLSGLRENPIHITTGNGEFRAEVSADGARVDYELTYRDLGGGPATGSHIHLGAPWTNGPIVVHFCGTGGKPACPAEGTTLQGSFTAADVQAAPDNNLAAGDLAGLLRAMRAGVTYVNVHNATFPGGEIRGQLKRVHERKGRDNDKDKDDDRKDGADYNSGRN
jgi:hypothetical protein